MVGKVIHTLYIYPICILAKEVYAWFKMTVKLLQSGFKCSITTSEKTSSYSVDRIHILWPFIPDTLLIYMVALLLLRFLI